jgi:hypothetical protein
VLILKEVKVICFDTLLQVFIPKGLEVNIIRVKIAVFGAPFCPLVWSFGPKSLCGSGGTSALRDLSKRLEKM